MNTAKGLDAIVVMTEAARGFDANWWNAEPDASIAQLGALVGALGCWRATEDGRRPAACCPPPTVYARSSYSVAHRCRSSTKTITSVLQGAATPSRREE